MKHVNALALLALIAVGCTDFAAPVLAPNVTAEQQARASRAMGLAFPPETRFLLYHRLKDNERGVPYPDDAVHLKVEMPASALASFLDQPPLSSATWTAPDRTVRDVAAWPDWQPSGIEAFRAEAFELPQVQGLYALIDDDREDPKVIYLYWFES